MSPGGETAEWLARYGPWGVVVLLVGAVIALWSRLNKERDERIAQATAINQARIDQLERLGKEHKAEMTTLLDRLVVASNTQVDKFAALADQSSRIAESLGRRIKPGRGGDPP